jgi:hypothetical protein
MFALYAANKPEGLVGVGAATQIAVGAEYAIHGVLFDFALCIDYLAVTNHHAGGIRYVQEKTGFDSDHLFNLPECLASEC